MNTIPSTKIWDFIMSFKRHAVETTIGRRLLGFVEQLAYTRRSSAVGKNWADEGLLGNGVYPLNGPPKPTNIAVAANSKVSPT